jgi:hypothetical protein
MWMPAPRTHVRTAAGGDLVLASFVCVVRYIWRRASNLNFQSYVKSYCTARRTCYALYVLVVVFYLI